MQIQLRQSEIITAIKHYITKQGISLNGKSAEVTFTAGRKETGILADISIEDVDAQQEMDLVVPVHPGLHLVPDNAAATVIEVAEATVAAAEEAVETTAEEVAAAPAVTAKSLFA